MFGTVQNTVLSQVVWNSVQNSMIATHANSSSAPGCRFFTTQYNTTIPAPVAHPGRSCVASVIHRSAESVGARAVYSDTHISAAHRRLGAAVRAVRWAVHSPIYGTSDGGTHQTSQRTDTLRSIHRDDRRSGARAKRSRNSARDLALTPQPNIQYTLALPGASLTALPLRIEPHPAIPPGLENRGSPEFTGQGQGRPGLVNKCTTTMYTARHDVFFLNAREPRTHTTGSSKALQSISTQTLRTVRGGAERAGVCRRL